MYTVPLPLPKYCNHCPFGMPDYSFPLWSKRNEVSKVDGKINEVGTKGYCCNVEFYEHKKYTKVMRGNIDEDIPRPKWCGLKRTKA